MIVMVPVTSAGHVAVVVVVVVLVVVVGHGPTSLHERAQDFQQVLGGTLLGGRRLLRRIEDVFAHVVLDDLGHEPGQRATTRGDGLQHGEALFAPVEQALDAVDLAADALDSQEELVAIALRVFHTVGEYSM